MQVQWWGYHQVVGILKPSYMLKNLDLFQFIAQRWWRCQTFGHKCLCLCTSPHAHAHYQHLLSCLSHLKKLSIPNIYCQGRCDKAKTQDTLDSRVKINEFCLKVHLNSWHVILFQDNILPLSSKVIPIQIVIQPVVGVRECAKFMNGIWWPDKQDDQYFNTWYSVLRNFRLGTLLKFGFQFAFPHSSCSLKNLSKPDST